MSYQASEKPSLSHGNIPVVIAGPMIRRLLPTQLVLWLVTTRSQKWELALYQSEQDSPFCQHTLNEDQLQEIQIGTRCFVQLINVHFDQPLPESTPIEYELKFPSECGVFPGEAVLAEVSASLCYTNYERPHFVVNTRIQDVLHGSCRKPHHYGDDALVQADEIIGDAVKKGISRPDVLFMTGDQIYADDVAGPMLFAIHQVIELLGLYDEQWEGARINDSATLYSDEQCYYCRDHLLPKSEENRKLHQFFYKGALKPIFTSVYSKNHLITLSEVLAMYLLVWSPELWDLIDIEQASIQQDHKAHYEEEKALIDNFVKGLPKIRRALAHIPVYMIFDDHDVTDDWNLHRRWEEFAYGHPFSKRIIGNALIGYWLMQAWGNAPENFSEATQNKVKTLFSKTQYTEHDQTIDSLLASQEWDYTLPTSPKVVVLDTRTNRWRSESDGEQPSGLMDWEMLSELQQELINQEAVIMISAAPVFGVKLIETIQKVFTFFGQPLTVDAENWMAHPGTANVILNIFRHKKTPKNFIILSGDVHYSFAYNIRLRFIQTSQRVWQITCSGLKNQFPERLLKVFDYLDRLLYASRSPLNWFTKRRSMRIKARKVDPKSFSHLVNACAIGRVLINEKGEPKKVSIITSEGDESVFETTD